MTRPSIIPPAELVAVLDRALTEPIGLSINTSRPDQLRDQIESARLARHADLEIVIPSIIEQLFIKRKGQSNA